MSESFTYDKSSNADIGFSGDNMSTLSPLSRFADIQENGTVRFNLQDDSLEKFRAHKTTFNHNNIIICDDGFCVSVAAGWGIRSIPSPGWGGYPEDYSGPYDSFEIGNPSSVPEPWSLWKLFCDDGDNPTTAKYYYVPAVMVRKLIMDHSH